MEARALLRGPAALGALATASKLSAWAGERLARHAERASSAVRAAVATRAARGEFAKAPTLRAFAATGRSVVADILEADLNKNRVHQRAARAAHKPKSLAEEAARREILLDALHGDLAPCPRATVTPCRALGGLSPVSFQVLFGTRADAWLQQGSRATSELAAQLKDQNEFLEDTHVYMTTFIERQKEKIESLEDEVRRLRAELELFRAQRAPDAQMPALD